MSFFEQSIYAIEEFISLRRKMGPHTWKQDKYLLALTASNSDSNAALEIEVQAGELQKDSEIAEEDLPFYQLD